MQRQFVLITLTLAILSPSLRSQGSDKFVTPLPAFTGPVPTTADSHPFDAAAHYQTPVDLVGHGYIEEEYFVSGTGHLYDWASTGEVTTKVSDRPFTTRILVRRPQSADRFTGTVIVELAHSALGFDFDSVYGFISDYVMARGDAYVAITISSNTIGAMKMFDKKRYANLSFPGPVANLCEGGGGGGRGGRGGRGGQAGANPRRPAEFYPPADDGVKWDIISQVGALLKSDTGPMAGLKPRILIGTDHTASDVHTYARAFGGRAVLASGKTVYDGFLVKEGAGPAPLNQCGQPLAPDDPRRGFSKVGPPVIFLVSENYAPRFASVRREDSDELGDQYRLYEVAGASHLDHWTFRHLPDAKDREAAGAVIPGGIWPFEYVCEPVEAMPDQLPEQYFMHAMFANLDDWVRRGVTPPHGERMSLKTVGASQPSFINDVNGNAMGGIRNPWVDVPAGTFVPQMTGQAACNQIGYWIPFSMGKMDALYGSYQNYQNKMIAGVDKLVQGRWLLKNDAEDLKAEIRSRGPKKSTDVEKTSAGDLKITPINHASVMLEVGGKVIHIDPTSQGDYSLMPKADLILITDIHGDHLDAQAIEWLKKSGTKIIAPADVAKTVTDATVVGNGGSLDLTLGSVKVKIEAVPMYNLKRGPTTGQLYHPKGRGNGYVLTIGGKRLYVSGDTEFIPEIKDLKGIDVAFLCMNLPFTQTPSEAAEAVKAFRPKVVYPYHYRGQDTRIFAEALKDEKGIEVRLRNWY